MVATASVGHGFPSDESGLTVRPAKPARGASCNFELPRNPVDPATAVLSPELQAQQLHERNPTTPTTPTFILSPPGFFGGCDEAKAGVPMLLGGWSRSKASQAKGPKERPSLHRPSTMLGKDEKTDLDSLASASDATAGQIGKGILGLPSLRYMLYTRKGRRDFKFNLRALTSYRSILALAVLLFVSMRLLLTPAPHIERGVNGRIAHHRKTDAVFLDSWIEHVIHHPVRARDKTGFAEMGLRTEMYSHLLRHPTLPNFERMERALWPFVPGINQLRQWWQASVQARPPPSVDPSASSAWGKSKLASRAFGGGHGGIHPGSRGIVMSLGYKGSVFASQFISIIREKHHNNIPIELYYYGDSDLPAKYRNYLTKTYRNVRCVDLESLGLFDPDLVQLERQGFAIKPFALLATNYTEVILADADSILLENPDRFFEEQGYLDTGTLFFHDRDHIRKGADDVVHEFMRNQLSLRGPSPRLAESAFWKKKGIFEQESGIVVVDKRKTDVFAALLFTAWQNMGEIRKKTTYRVWWGDKESFWLAFELSRFPYYFVPRYAQAIGTTRRVTKAEKRAAAAAAKAKAEKAKKAEAAHAGEVDKAGEPEKDHPLVPATLEEDSSADDLDEEEEFCSEHPLHFLGADVEDQNGDGVVDAMTLGRPAWFNGGILDVKVLSDEIYIKPNAYTLDGDWEFLFDEEKWCMRNYTKGDLHQFDLAERIEEIKVVARKAEDKFRSKIPKEKSTKQAVLEEK